MIIIRYKKKGFTLVELLAVIVILAIILAIAVPGISNIIKDTTKNAFATDAKMVIKALEYKLLENGSYDVASINESNIKSNLDIDNTNYQSISVKKMDNKIYVTIVGQGKWSDLTASGTKVVAKISDTQTTFVRGANAPVLATGMTPIKWNGSAWVNTTSDDVAWYNYDTTNKIWANAKTADGSMWVWIPRYIYRIPTANWHTATAGTIDIQFTKGVNDNWNKASIGAINTGEGASASNNTWTNHPAFTFGDNEITGFWIAKFEPTAVEGVTNGYTEDGTCVAGDNVTTKTVKVVPNVSSWRCIQIGNAFTVTRNMETNSVYGWGTSGSGIDTHIMKNIEWGAVTYLYKSQYGNLNELWSNSNNSYTTGCAGSGTAAVNESVCNQYQTTDGVKASTTGNIYGVYDMSGAAWERTPSYVNNGNSVLTENGSNILSAENKYKDIYTVGSPEGFNSNYALMINKKGDAVYETSNLSYGPGSWYNDESIMVAGGGPFFHRGGMAVETPGEVGIFGFNSSTGREASYGSFRPIILVGTGL